VAAQRLHRRGRGSAGKRFTDRPERRFYFDLALALGRSVKELLETVDSQELSEWYAYQQRWPLENSWQQTARICRTIMAASGNYKRVPDEEVFIPASKRPKQSQDAMLAELMKLQKPQG
jgi:hypothetical protein